MRFQTGPAEWEISIFSLDKKMNNCDKNKLGYGK